MRKKSWKRILSAVLASAMILTAAPSNLSLIAQATEDTAEDQLSDEEEPAVGVNEESDDQSDSGTGTEETGKNAVGGGIEKDNTSDDSEDEADDVSGDDKSSETGTPKTDKISSTVTPLDNEDGEGYSGPTIDYDPDGDDPGAVTFYFPYTADTVLLKGGWDSSWNVKFTMESNGEDNLLSYTIPTETLTKTSGSVEYGFEPNGGWSNDNANPHTGGNSRIYRNPIVDDSGDITLYYYPKHGDYPTDVTVKYRKKDTADYQDKQMSLDSVDTAVYSVKLDNLDNGDYEYYFDVDGTEVQDTNNAKQGEFTKATYAAEDPSVDSPVIGEDGKVTFYYYGPTKNSVQLAGTMTDWGNGALDMTLNSDTGYWSVTVELGPEWHEYKFIVDSNWILDPLNEKIAGNGNNYFVIAGLKGTEVSAKRGGTTELPTELDLWSADTEKSESVAVTYDLSEETKAKEYADKITLPTEEKDGKTVTTLSVASDLPDTVDTFTLTASDKDNNISTITVTVVDAVYTYTIYYYDPNPEHMSTDASALWIWQTSGAGATDQTKFDGIEKLSDGNEWLKATVEVSYTDISLIPKANGSWAWQDGQGKKYVNADAAEEVTLYTVYDDPVIYTELPEIKVAEARYLVVEYTRETKKDGHWQFYTWNSGFGSDVWVPFEAAEDGTLIAKVPVKQGVESISFCLAREEGGDNWAEKDGNDYLCPVPADQNVVKVKIEEGKGIVYTYPYNKGYEIETSDGKINFYYRDDEAFLEGSEGGYETVTLDVIVPETDGQESSALTAPMTYDAEEQRYEYVLAQLTPGDHYYRYGRQKTKESDVEYVLDKFNDKTETVEGTEYSVLEYDLLDFSIDVSMQNSTMDYNDNNVLTIKVNAKDSEGNKIEDVLSQNVISSATVDLSAVGGGITQIDPELLEIAIAVKEGTSAGEKTLPIKIYDTYNNVYETSAKVTVVNRSKGSDFDWDEAVIYFAVTDRFFDGNTGNNNPGYDTSATGGSSYHGGDFAGLTQKLDYLQDLGINTIWITPIVANDMADGLSTDVSGVKSWGYHGYWASNFEKLDSHLGTEQEFKALLDAAHARGIKIMVDVVLNHSGYNQEDYFNNLLKDEEGNSIPMIRTEDQMVSGSDQKYSLSGLPDFLTENKEVRDLLVEWQSNWISKYDIDYYRVDTVKHVDDTTWSAFKNALTLIDPDFKMIGEWAGAGYATDTGMLRTGRMDSLLDFDFNDQATAFVTGNISGTENFMVSRNGAIDNTATLGAFLGSHDEVGFAQNLMDERKLSQEQASALALVAASLQITAKGQVVIYYGEEIGMTGENNYPYQTNRYDFDWSQTTGDNAALAHYKTMLALRNMYSEVFAKGTRTTISADDSKGLDVFTRSYGGTTLTVALNIKDQAQQYTLSGRTPGAELFDYYSNTVYTADENGNITIDVPAAADGGTVVLGTEKLNVTIEEGMQIKSIPNQTYTGKSITLSETDLQVYNGTTRLTAGKDYTVSYKDNKVVGTATVTIKGKGNYNETLTAQFSILPRNIGEVEITYNDYVISTGKQQKPLTKIAYNGSKLNAKDYTVEYYQVDDNGSRTSEALDGVTEVGKYEMVITGQRYFTGVVTKAVEVKDGGTYMSKTTINIKGLTKNATPYTGQAIEPDVEVKNSGETLEKDTHYTVTYEDNVNVGTAKVIITGKPDAGYYGSVTMTFKITGTALSSAAQVDTSTWQKTVALNLTTGTATQPNPVLKPKKANVTLTKGKDYTVSYSNNTTPGTATVLFTGMGQYTGTIKKTFKISAVALSANDKALKVVVNGNAPYAKKGAKANVTVTYNNVTLTEGKDYKVTYNNNKAVTVGKTINDNKKPSVNITGMGSYSGTVKNAAIFEIEQANLSSAGITMTVSDAVYSDQAGKFMSTPVLKEADGTILVANKDYTVAYYVGEDEKTNNDAVAADTTVTVKITAKDDTNYTGEISKTYRVVSANISKANVVVKAQTYSGKAITLDAADFTKVKVGKDLLTYGEDYEIVPGSYANNVNKGSATVTIRGIGNYGGERKVTFRITSYGLRWFWDLFS